MLGLVDHFFELLCSRQRTLVLREAISMDLLHLLELRVVTPDVDHMGRHQFVQLVFGRIGGSENLDLFIVGQLIVVLVEEVE